MDDEVANRLTPLSEPVTETRQPAARRGRRGWGVALLLLAAVAGAVVWFHPVTPTRQESGRGGGRFRGGDLGPQPVAVAPVTQADIPIVLEALGTVTSLSTVTVRSQVAGQITQIGFTEGQNVKKGDFLAQVDDRTLQASLHQLQGQLERDQALLADAKLDLDRDLKLTTNAVTQQAVDLQRATVQADEGTVVSDQAQIEAMQVNVANSHITAPADGRIGLRLVDQGNYVTPGDGTGIAVIAQMQPISVIFALPEDSLSQVLEQARDGAPLKATLFDRNDTKQIAEGTLQTIDNQIDPTTGTVKLRAVFPNAEAALYPNQFVNVHLLVRTLTGITVVPNAAIQHGAPGTFVYELNDDDTVSVKTVSLGPGDASVTQLLSGLSPGAKVVVDGVDRLKDGARVSVPDTSAGAADTGNATAKPSTAAAGGAPDAVTPTTGSGGAPSASEGQGGGATPATGQETTPSGKAGGDRQHRHHHRRDGQGNGGGAAGGPNGGATENSNGGAAESQ